MVGIPPETERDVLKGASVHIPIYADATYLFIFRTTANGIAVAINTLSSDSLPAAHASMAAWSRRRSRRQVQWTFCSNRFLTRSVATAATLCRRRSC